MADLSKVNVLGTLYNLKDAKAREDFATLLGTHTLEALKAAAWQSVDSAVSDSATGVPSTVAVKDYVDAQIETIPEFDVVVVTELPTASKDTFHKIYLLKRVDEGQNKYAEYLTIRSGSEGSYTYTWEKIGDIEVDLSEYVKKTTKVAGIDLQNDITVAEMEEALDLKALSHADTATGSDTVDTIDTIVMDDVTVAGNATVTHTATTYTIPASQKADYTPAGTLMVDNTAQATGNKVLKGGSISVELEDVVASATDITYGDYKPAGSVTLTASETGSFQVAGSNAASAVTIDASDDTFVKSLKAGNVDAAAIDSSKFDGGAIASWTGADFTPATYSHTGFSGGSFSKGSAVSAAIEGVVASVGTGDNAETLILTAAQKDNVMDFDASYTEAVYGTDTFDGGDVDWGTFDGGRAAAINTGFFTAQKLPVVDGTASALTGINSAEAAAQVFTGSKFAPAFDGTTAAIKATAVAYNEQAVKTATFSPVEAAISFSGTKAEKLVPTAITYDRADANAAFSETVTPAVKNYNRTAKTVEITVSPDAE